MLTAQKAQKQLAFFKVADWKQKRVEQMAKLPEGLKEVGLGILGNYSILSIQVILDKTQNLGINLLNQIKDNHESADYVVVYQVQQAAIKALVTLAPSERIQIFRILFPQFFSYVENAWQLLNCLPYQLGIGRKSFRINHHPEIHNSVRSQWLSALLSTVVDYEQDLPWLAAWANYIDYYTEPLGILFAAAIDTADRVGSEVFNILVASARGEHEIGTMGHHVTRALLVASRRDGWEVIENLLLGARGHEGYRQVILETIDEAHPEAFKRMLRLIIEQDLTRFSATIQAAGIWLGLNWEAVDSQIVKESLKTVLYFLENPDELTTIVETYSLNSVETRNFASLPNAEILYLGLWSMGFQDAFTAIPIAANLLYHHCIEYRLVATYFLSQLGLAQAQDALLSALTDEDLRIVILAIRGLTQPSVNPRGLDLFAHLEQQLSRFPEKPTVLPTLVWDWLEIETSQAEVASILYDSLGRLEPKYLIPYLSLLSVDRRRNLAEKLARLQPWDEEIRKTLFTLVGDSSQWVREQVIDTLKQHPVTHSEASLLEGLLTRKSGDLRRGVLELLLNQKDADVLTSIERLLDSKNSLQRRASLELCRELKQQKRPIEQCSTLIQSYRDHCKTLTEAETQIIENILEVVDSEATLENALLSIEPRQLTPIEPPSVEEGRNFVSEAAKECLRSLDELIHQYCQTPVTITTWQGGREELFGNINWQFPHFDPRRTVEANLALLPLREVWQTWYENRPNFLRDADGLELLRAAVSSFGRNHVENSGIFDNLRVHQKTWWQQTSRTLFIDTLELQYPIVVQNLLSWLLYLDPPSNGVDFLLDGVATTLLLIPFAEIEGERNLAHLGWQLEGSLLGWLNFTRMHRSYFASQWTPRQQIRYWQLLRWLDRYLLQPKLTLEDVLLVYSLDGATQADVMAYLLAPSQHPTRSNNFRDLHSITGRKLPPLLAQCPILKEIGDRCRQRILEIELQRGDLPTAASEPALSLQSISGIAHVLKLLQALGKEKFVRGETRDDLSRAAVFSHLVRVSFPSETETPEDFAKQAQANQIREQTLIEMAFYAPQWANYVEKALNWKDFAEAVWWMHTHTKDDRWQVTQEVRETWAAQSSERTPLASQSLIDGAVDVAWFKRVYGSLEAEKWQKLNKAAKYASSGSGYKRAQLFADVMLGRIERAALLDRIDEKRHQDSVRALGLLPLAQGRQRESDLLDRYQILQDFIGKSRQFGASRRESERLAATIGLENLARTAGYADPQRLEWAMEARAIADLTHHPLTVVINEVSVSLSLSPQGEPLISVFKNGRALKSIPALLNREPKIKELKTRRQEITRQAQRMRLSLAEAMIRGDRFTAAELKQLYGHPLLKPMLEHLIFIGDGEMGYPVDGGTALQAYDGQINSIRSQFLQIAHAYDLSITEQWPLWQAECFSEGRIQPFKQVFRELYLLTVVEGEQEKFSRRYEGYQVDTRRALALLSQRGWVNHPSEGVKKTFHQANISAWITFRYGFYFPLEVEGAIVNTVSFTRRGESVVLPIAEIPPRLFSEVMRDLDLVVSMADRGGVAPQASPSTIEMRSALVRETCRLLKYDNVQLQGSQALIAGQLSQYSVHLGSAVVHRQPGGDLCKVPVATQQRGRLFLPFADDDPLTAEVLAKVILLARDGEIEEGNFLTGNRE